MPPRLYVATDPLLPETELALPPEAARHVQVLRLQPGDALRLFDGRGGEWEATVRAMGRREVTVVCGRHHALEREPAIAVTLAVGMPANDRMDALVEKATELGVAAIQPLQCERSVLRLDGERAERRRAHWQAVAVAAAEQSGRTRVPTVAPVQTLAAWLQRDALPAGAARWLLSLAPDAAPWRAAVAAAPAAVALLSGPEGGFAAAEEAAARDAGWRALALGPRVLRADTAPLAALAGLVLHHAA